MNPENVFKTFEIDHIHENEQRKFSCWGSVEVKDRHGEIIPAEEVYKVMDIWMDRGSPIMFNHTNRQIGKGINWQPLNKNGNPGVLITGIIFKHYAEDDEVWNGIKKGQFEGLSIGGKSYQREDSADGTILRKLIGYEFSVVERTGNQEATFVDFNTLAKSNKKMVTEEIKKEEPLVETPEEETKEESIDFKALIDALMEKVSALESRVDEMTAGKPEEPEEAVEESKEEEDNSEDEEEDNVTKKLSELESKIVELTKSMTPKVAEVKKTVETPRPSDITKSESKIDKARALYKSGKIDFVEVGKIMRGIE